MTTYYKPVSVDEELPEKDGRYFTGKEVMYFYKSGPRKNRPEWMDEDGIAEPPTHWLKPVEGVMLTREQADAINDALAFLQEHYLSTSNTYEGIAIIRQLLTSGSEGGEK